MVYLLEVGMSLGCSVNFFLCGLLSLSVPQLMDKLGPTRVLGLFAWVMIVPLGTGVFLLTRYTVQRTWFSRYHFCLAPSSWHSGGYNTRRNELYLRSADVATHPISTYGSFTMARKKIHSLVDYKISALGCQVLSLLWEKSSHWSRERSGATSSPLHLELCAQKCPATGDKPGCIAPCLTNDGFLHPVCIKYLIRETFCYYQAHRNQFQESSSHLISFKRGKAPGDGSIKQQKPMDIKLHAAYFWDKYI